MKKKPDHDINIMLHTGEKECVQNIFTQSAPRFVEAVLAATDIQAPLAKSVYQSHLNDTNYKSCEKKLRPQDPPRFRVHGKLNSI